MPRTASDSTALTTEDRPFWRTAVVLLLLIAVTRLPFVLTTVTPARDMFRFLDAAEQLQADPSLSTLSQLDVHPLYPLSLVAIERLAKWMVPHMPPGAFLLWLQGWSVLCYAAFLILTYSVGRRWLGHRTAFWGCVIVSLLPRQIGYSCDVLSDNLHAALWMGTLAAAAKWFERPRPAWAFAAGLIAFAAFLTRVEAVLLLAILGATIGIRQWSPNWRHRMGDLAKGISAFAVAYLPLMVSWMLLIGSLSPRPTSHAMINVQSTKDSSSIEKNEVTAASAGTDEVSFAGENLAITHQVPTVEQAYRDQLIEVSPAWGGIVESEAKPASMGSRMVTASVRTFKEFAQETRVLLLIAFLIEIGILLHTRWRSRRANEASLATLVKWDHPSSGSAAVLTLVAIGMVAAMGMMLRYRAGYLSGRYLMTVLPLLAMVGVRGGERLLVAASWWPRTPRLGWWIPSLPGPVFLAIVLVLPGLSKLARPLHPYRQGHVEAADWLSQNTEPGEPVFDPARYASFLADRPTIVTPEQWTQQREHGARMAVIDPALLVSDDQEIRTAVRQMERDGTVVARFGDETVGESRVFVVRMAADFLEVGVARKAPKRGGIQ